MITLVLAARRSLADSPSRISWVSRLAAVSARSSVAASVTPVPSRSDAVDAAARRRAPDLRRGAVHQHDADVQRPQQRHVEQQRREVVVGDDRAVDRQNERLLAELRNVLEDAPQVGQFHVSAPNLGVAAATAANEQPTADEYVAAPPLWESIDLLVSAAVSVSGPQGSTTKLANCQRSSSATAGVPHLANSCERLLERRPVRLNRRTGAQVGAGHVENLLVGNLVGDEDPLMRVPDHEDQPADHRRRHLEGGRVLAGTS